MKETSSEDFTKDLQYLKEKISTALKIPNDVLDTLEDSPSLGSTKLDDQIKYMQAMNKIIRAPIITVILNSLKELKGIKNKTLNV